MTTDLPSDLLFARRSELFGRAMGLRWTDAPPTGYLDVPSMPEATREAWRATFEELRFVAETDDGDALALWRFEPGIAWVDAPVVKLDTEGQLSMEGATFADALVARWPDPSRVLAFFRGHGVDVAPDRAIADARVRFLPHPNDRHERRREPARAVRTTDPETLEDLLRMSARDPRVARALASIERPDRPLQLWTDGQGRTTVLFLEPDRLTDESVRVRGVGLGDSPDVLQGLGEPSRRGHLWATWDRDGVRMHVQSRDGRVHLITLSEIDALPPHLR